MLAEVDCFVCPSISNTTRTKSEKPYRIDSDEWYRLVINDIFSKPFDFSGVPTLCAPCGISADGLPLSAQFVASRLDEDTVLRAGHAYELATQGHRKHPPI
jgi:Asp-tRNA(Asn)/Glu-tRNA(Gln) amidotransferase A subunit family amidase